MNDEYTEMTTAQICGLAREFAPGFADTHIALDNTPHLDEDIERGVGTEDTIIRDAHSGEVLCWVSPQGGIFK